VRQRGTVDPLCGKHIRVVHVGDLLGGERLGGAENHVAGVVDQHVDPARLGQHRVDGLIDGRLIGDVHLDRTQSDVVLVGVRTSVGSRPLVPPACNSPVASLAPDTPHARVHNVFRVGEGANRERAEATRRSGDENDLGLGHQMTPPLT
jgi:hypothetical protein